MEGRGKSDCRQVQGWTPCPRDKKEGNFEANFETDEETDAQVSLVTAKLARLEHFPPSGRVYYPVSVKRITNAAAFL